MNLLEINHICKTYGNGDAAVHALRNVSFSVPKGEHVAIVGESGSGKSTLLNMIGALDTPTSGKVMICGNDIFSMSDRKRTIFRRRNIGFIFQAFNLIPELTVEQNIIFPVLLDYQKPDKQYLEELLTIQIFFQEQYRIAHKKCRNNASDKSCINFRCNGPKNQSGGNSWPVRDGIRDGSSDHRHHKAHANLTGSPDVPYQGTLCL